MDRRQKKTKYAIFNAFCELLRSKRYESITVGEIIEKADICRSTFYMHFETKDMLLKSLCSDIFDHIFEGDLCDYHESEPNIESKLAHILFHIKTCEIDIQGILSGESGELFTGYLKEHLRRLFTASIDEFNTSVPSDFLINHLIGSFCETICWWCKNKMVESPEVVAGYFMQTVETHSKT